MINPLPTSFEKIAVTCGICHDQCAAACPVVKSSRSLGAYPSRLAMLAWELSRETIPMDRTVLAAMQQCIHCNACTAHCVFIDQPVDITPLIRWSRQQLIENGWATEAMQALAVQADANNNPSGAEDRRMSMLADTPFADGSSSEAVLLLVDATTTQKAPGMVKSALRLLSAIGWKDVRVSSCLDCGGDLFEYGYTAAARACAQRIAGEVEHAAVREVITVTAAATHLLRQVYPAELGVSIPAQVRPLSKVLQDAIKPGLLRKNQQERALLVLSTTELYKIKDRCAVEILRSCCQVVNDPLPAHLLLSELAYPDSPALDLTPDPRTQVLERILLYAEAMQATRIVTTEPAFLFDYQQQDRAVPAVDLYSRVLESIA